MKKRRVTKKRIGAVSVVTNPKFIDDYTDAAVERDRTMRKVDDALKVLRDELSLIMLHGNLSCIAIGRARATASGKRRKPK